MRELPDGGYEVGALTTYADIIEGTKLSWVAEAVEGIGDVQVRNRGTVGGSIAHCDPASDLPAIALALDYSAVLRSVRGERTVPLDGFFDGPFQTQAEPDELLVAIRRGPIPDGAVGAYKKLEQPASGYSIVGVAAVIASSGGSISHARVAITGVGEAPYRAKAVEEALAGRRRLAGRRSPPPPSTRPTARPSTATSTPTATTERTMAVVYTRRAIEAALGR